jgi:hypothetical protein
MRLNQKNEFYFKNDRIINISKFQDQIKIKKK